MINSRILHVSIDIVIQFSNVEMYKDFLVLDTSYGYYPLLWFISCLSKKVLLFDYLFHQHNMEFLFEFHSTNVVKLLFDNKYFSYFKHFYCY